MILAVDIGNTTISFAIIDKGKVRKSWKIETSLKKQQQQFRLLKILSQVNSHFGKLKGSIICCVVPGVLPLVKSAIQNQLRKRPVIIGQDRFVPITNRYQKPSQVGQDRLVCAYAAKKIYGAPAIVIDFGTAITFDVISKKGDYLGGLIVPGIQLSTESLFKKTALLPLVRIKKPNKLIGKNTQDSILSGIFYGYGALCDGLIMQLSQKCKKKPVVIATGGYISLIKKFSSKIQKTDPKLVFKGMELVFHKSSSADKEAGRHSH